MPEVKELSEALPETPMDPITGVGVVASRNRAPTGYDVVRLSASLSVLLSVQELVPGRKMCLSLRTTVTARGGSHECLALGVHGVRG